MTTASISENLGGLRMEVAQGIVLLSGKQWRLDRGGSYYGIGVGNSLEIP